MFWVGLLLFVVVGGELGAVVRGAGSLGNDDGSGVVQFVIGVNAVPWTALLAAAVTYGGRRRQFGLDRKSPLSPALARIEDAEATGEGPDHRLKLDLTVAPEGRPAYRAHATAKVNVMHLREFEAGRTLGVSYDPERPWRIQAPSRCADSGALIPLDTAPESSRVTEPKVPLRGPLLGVLAAILLGLAAYYVKYGF
ncbi:MULTISPECIES: hypothetical protein [Kitasatospora]|uniref:DUF3592 domain-containing protein n=1 Tax=Kitasatospora setae (strain ATCC 33774 / DSM 43861 / JCM 3304 / KCC A-0304 / NBRC 14216 / KM-6054) TaxID=452652 RepID=E4N0A5_KITSK|nr:MULTISPECIES: hypothetical protein [Kitasatospora]BAJ31433.1 hypothetical protein KSE_56600 [Kitasatospora setae KM-6054]